ncbi:hypothetical protein BX600DRAFT_537838 [Xylariales sp. PMI_506]|nr:hypothetical protein BX600DRAFT_537838 [Xylariales sp. PMI_506]
MVNGIISQPFTFNSGLTVPNRLVKAALAEGLSDNKQLPSPELENLYSKWGAGGWGMIFTGNVQVDTLHLGGPNDVAFNRSVPYEEQLGKWKSWAQTCKRNGTPTLVQVNHPGRQSPAVSGKRGFWEKSMAPSSVPLDFGSGVVARLMVWLMFGSPRPMTRDDIAQVVDQFVETALLSLRAGFDGIVLHAAHGYLLAQFLSPVINCRTDEYGGSPANRARIVIQIIKAIRAAVPAGFTVGIKINSADHQDSARERVEVVEQIKLITASGSDLDFLEISGGTYENPTMNGPEPDEAPKSESTKKREAFFLEFAEIIRRELPQLPLMVTGGFRTRAGMEATLSQGSCDLVGLGRPAVIEPALPKLVVFNPKIKDAEARLQAPYAMRLWWWSKLLGMKIVGAGGENLWYQSLLQNMAKE